MARAGKQVVQVQNVHVGNSCQAVVAGAIRGRGETGADRRGPKRNPTTDPMSPLDRCSTVAGLVARIYETPQFPDHSPHLPSLRLRLGRVAPRPIGTVTLAAWPATFAAVQPAD